MTGDQAIGLFVAVGLSPFVTVFLIALADGDVKLRTVVKALQVGMLFCSAVVISDAQGQAQAQQDSTRRIERLENQSRDLEGLTRELNQFSQSQASRVNELVKAQTDTLLKVEVALANHDTRLKELESGLVRFEAVAEGVDGTVKMIGGGLSLVIAIGSGIIVWQQKKKPHWANGPLDKIVKDQDDILKLLDQSQPRRRTR